MSIVIRSAFAGLVAWAVMALAATPAAAETQTHHHRHHHAAAAKPAAGVHKGRHHGVAASAAAAHGAHGRHHHGAVAKVTGRGKHHARATLSRTHAPVTHKRHAALCQSVMVHHHWVQHCRG